MLMLLSPVVKIYCPMMRGDACTVSMLHQQCCVVQEETEHACKGFQASHDMVHAAGGNISPFCVVCSTLSTTSSRLEPGMLRSSSADGRAARQDAEQVAEPIMQVTRCQVEEYQQQQEATCNNIHGMPSMPGGSAEPCRSQPCLWHTGRVYQLQLPPLLVKQTVQLLICLS